MYSVFHTAFMIESEYQTWFLDTVHLQNASCLTEYCPLLWFKPFTKKQAIFLLNCYLSESRSSSTSQQGTGERETNSTVHSGNTTLY